MIIEMTIGPAGAGQGELYQLLGHEPTDRRCGHTDASPNLAMGLKGGDELLKVVGVVEALRRIGEAIGNLFSNMLAR